MKCTLKNPSTSENGNNPILAPIKIGTKKLTIKDHNEAFEKIIAGLNPSQREAVETIEGPVLVIAGPGTGKTHILAARIGKILLETDAQPHNILCLTFTEAGVRSMRQRLIDFIGPEAHRVHVHTFHSFCNKIIRENLEVFGRKELEPISELERIELLQKLIDELPLDHRLRRGRGSDIYFYICLLYTSPSPRDATLSRMPSSA